MSWIVSLVVALAAAAAYLGLAIWSFRTPNGLAWRVFCAVAAADFLRSAVWAYRVATHPAVYQSPSADLVLILVFQLAGAVLTAGLALALRGVALGGKSDRAKGRPSTGPEGGKP